MSQNEHLAALNAHFVKCSCNHCSAHIEFEIQNAGRWIQCPHCDMDTLLYVPQPPHVEAPPVQSFLSIPPSKQERNWSYAESIAVAIPLIVLLFSGLGQLMMEKKNDEIWLQWIEANFAFAIAWIIYLIPSIVGRRKRNAIAILVLNIFLGWTLIGWVVALVWAVTVERE